MSGTPSGSMKSRDLEALQAALQGLQATATNFASQCIKDSRVRVQYIKDIKAMAAEFLSAVERGTVTSAVAAEQATQLRNQIMDLARLRSSPVGRAYAMQLKRSGRTFGSLLEAKATEVFKKSFSALSESEQAAIYMRIVQSAGRGNAIESAFANTLGKVGKRLFLVSLGVAVYEIYEAEDKSRETARQGALAGASVIGGWAAGAGAVASGLCAATAPVCVGVAALLGGLLCAFGADFAFGTVYPVPRK